MITKETVIAQLQVAQEKREALRDQLNACMGYIQACQFMLAETERDNPQAAEQSKPSLVG